MLWPKYLKNTVRKLHSTLQLIETIYGITKMLRAWFHLNYYMYSCHNNSILKTLQDRIVERESIPGSEQSMEKNAWNLYWTESGPTLFVYACSHGSVEAVKLLMEIEHQNGSDGTLLKDAMYNNYFDA